MVDWLICGIMGIGRELYEDQGCSGKYLVKWIG